MATRLHYNQIDISPIRRVPGGYELYHVIFEADRGTILISDEQGPRRFDSRVIQFLLIGSRNIPFGAINESKDDVAAGNLENDLLLNATNTYAAELGQPKEIELDAYDVKMLINETCTNAIARKENQQLNRLFLHPHRAVQTSMLNEFRYYFARRLVHYFSYRRWPDRPRLRDDAGTKISIIYRPDTHTVTLVDRPTIISGDPPRKVELDGRLCYALLVGERNTSPPREPGEGIASLPWVVYKTVKNYGIAHGLPEAESLDFQGAKMIIGAEHQEEIAYWVGNSIIGGVDDSEKRQIMYELVKWYGERQSGLLLDLMSIYDTIARAGGWNEELEVEKLQEQEYYQQYYRRPKPKNRVQQYVPRRPVSKVRKDLERHYQDLIGQRS